MSRLDPRAQLAWLAAAVLAALFGGDVGLVASGAVALSALVLSHALGAWLPVLMALLPLAALVVLLEGVAGQPASGVRVAARLLVLASVGVAFARLAEGEALIAGLRALRVPYPVTFVLVVGARFVPATVADLSQLRDAARLRGLPLEGPPWRQLAGWRVLLVPLLVGTIRRGLQLGEAMEARAFGASPHRTTRVRLKWRARDTLAAVSAVGYLAAILGLARS